jgi:SAM-dependent methyltransferase
MSVAAGGEVVVLMQIDPNLRRETVSHYDEAYYLGHYGDVIGDEFNYRLLSIYWRYVLFVLRGLDTRGNVLDFGCGLGQVSAALAESVCFDPSPFAQAELLRRGRKIIENRADIPKGTFDYVLSSHSLEHSRTPFQDLEEFQQYTRPAGRIVLVLPVETNLSPALQPDLNQHLHAWTFQTITNLLRAAGWTPLSQTLVFGPFMLRTLGRRVPPERAVRAAYALGRLKQAYPAMLTIAQASG